MGPRILWALVGGFLIGVFARSVLPLGLSYAALLLLLAAASAGFAFLERSRAGSYLVLAVALVAIAGGIARMNVATLQGDPTLDRYLGKKVAILGVVEAEPDVREAGERIAVRVDRMIVGSTTISVHAGVLVLAPPHAGARYGDTVRTTGTLRIPEAFETTTGRSFDYSGFLAKDGIGYELAFAQIEPTGENRGNPIVAAAISAKQTYLQGERLALPEPAAGLAGGITVGDKRSIGTDLSKDFQRVSLIHMIVLSGYNITIVMNAVRWMLQLMPRYVQYASVGSAVIFFVLMTGGAASAVRAGAMALIAVLARATGRVFLAARILGVVAFCMVLWNPFTLAFDPSFELSALATLGLIFFTPHFAARLHWLPEKFALREIVASTLATQLFVLPLLLYQNGTLSLVSLPANVLALIPVPWAMFASFVAATGGMLFGSYAVPLAAPAYLLLSYIIAVAQFFAALPFAAVSIPAFGIWWLIAAYALLTAILWLKRKKDDKLLSV